VLNKEFIGTQQLNRKSLNSLNVLFTVDELKELLELIEMMFFNHPISLVNHHVTD